jgi:hypothetical protein
LKNFSVYLTICLLCTSCETAFYPLAGNYPTPPADYSRKAYYEVWANTIQYASANNIDIKLDSSKGLIVLKRIKLPATYEDENGALFFPESYLAVEREKPEQGIRIKRPEKTYVGDIEILFSFENNSTRIVINMEKIETIDEQFKSNGGMYYVRKAKVKSTGLLENLIYNNIK